jgi:hypothetical protein
VGLIVLIPKPEHVRTYSLSSAVASSRAYAATDRGICLVRLCPGGQQVEYYQGQDLSASIRIKSNIIELGLLPKELMVSVLHIGEYKDWDILKKEQKKLQLR